MTWQRYEKRMKGAKDITFFLYMNYKNDSPKMKTHELWAKQKSIFADSKTQRREDTEFLSFAPLRLRV